MKTMAKAAAGLALAAMIAGCNDNAAPVASSPSQSNQQAVDTSANPAATPDSNSPAANAQAFDQVSRTVATPDTEPRRSAKPARAATRSLGAGVRAHVDVFYNELERYGSWARHPDFSYVWLPARQGRGWRPYQEGRWIWTDEYGWYWESSEPFAWAVYHYGRWDYDPEFGWFWVPGDTWAPAWVTWRHGGGRTGWAPIAPDRRGYAAGIPNRFKPPVLESWVFVEDRNFADPDLGHYIAPIPQIGAMLEAASDLAAPIYDNGVVINRGVRREEIERTAGRRVEAREIVYVGHEADAFEDMRAARLGIYRPMIESVEIRQPPRVTVTDITRVDRVIIREYTNARIPGLPSVALLAVLDDRERRSLQDDRLSQQEAALDHRIERLQQERAALLEERRLEAERLQAQIEQERQDGIRRRMQEQRHLREQRRQRAETVGDIDVESHSTQPVKPEPSSTAPVEAPRSVAEPEAARHAPPTSAPAVSARPMPPARQTPSAIQDVAPSAKAPAAKPVEPTPPAAHAITPTAKPVEPVPSAAPATALEALPPRSATAPTAPRSEPDSHPGGAVAPQAKPVERVLPPAPATSPKEPPRSAVPGSPPAERSSPPAAPAADPDRQVAPTGGIVPPAHSSSSISTTAPAVPSPQASSTAETNVRRTAPPMGAPSGPTPAEPARQ